MVSLLFLFHLLFLFPSFIFYLIDYVKFVCFRVLVVLEEVALVFVNIVKDNCVEGVISRLVVDKFLPFLFKCFFLLVRAHRDLVAGVFSFVDLKQHTLFSVAKHNDGVLTLKNANQVALKEEGPICLDNLCLWKALLPRRVSYGGFLVILV